MTFGTWLCVRVWDGLPTVMNSYDIIKWEAANEFINHSVAAAARARTKQKRAQQQVD